MTAWRSRIVGQGEEPPAKLLANPLNWRVHPPAQQAALESALDSIGWIQQVIVNRTTGHMVDGHARVQIALRRNEPTVPVLYVELNETEERAALASLDPLAAMAVTDPEALFGVVDGLQTGHAGFDAYLATQRDLAGSTRVRGAAPDVRRLSDPAAVVKIVLPAGELGLIERALAATGLMNRADALAVICRKYLDAERQHHAGTQDGAAPVTAATAPGPARGHRNPRRSRQGVGG